MKFRRSHLSRHEKGNSHHLGGLMLILSLLTLSGAEPESGKLGRLKDERVPVGDSLVPKRDAELWNTLRRASPFASEAQRQGITISEAEVAGRLELYKKLYPNQSLDASRTKRLLLAEKYLESKGIGVGKDVPDGLVVKKVDPSLFVTQKDAEMAKRATMVEALIWREDLYQEAKELDELAQMKRESERVPTPLWPLRDIQVAGDPGECLAWQGNNCIVNLGEYNAAAIQFRMPAKVPMDSAKEWILKRYLLDKKLAAEGSALGLDQSQDSILKAQKLRLNGKRWIQSARALGMVVQDLQTLQSLYGKHYHEFFAAWVDATFDIIGSSDSAYIDSLHKVLSAWNNRRRTNQLQGKPGDKEPDLPWISVQEKDLPRELTAVIDSFHVGQISAPLHSRMGFFIVRLSKLMPHEEVLFDDAIPQLIFLATRNNFLKKDSILEIIARKYYKDHKAQYALPDTLEVLSWLLPQELTKSNNPGGASMRQTPRPDTARFKSLTLSSLILPKELQMKLHSLTRADSNATYFGPFSGKLGRWYFRIRSKKLAHDTLPFRFVRKEILEKISSPLPEQPSGLASDESQNEVMLTLGTALAVRRKEYKRQRMSGENGGSGQEFETPPSEASEAEKAYAMEQMQARLKARRDKKRIEEEEMLQTTWIDFTRLLK